MPKKTTKKVVKKQYTATAKVMGKNFKGTGETIYEAIGNITPGGVAGNVILTVESKTGKKERILSMSIARRTFNTIGLTREVSLKNISNMFEGL